MPNPVMQWQMISKNPDASAQFYAELFGWKISDANALGYKEAKTGGCDGGFWPAPPEGMPMIQLFVGVPDVKAHFEKALAMGAKAVVPPQQLPDGDEMALVLDPQGLVMGLMKAR